MADYVVPPTLAPLLGLSPPTLRRTYEDARSYELWALTATAPDRRTPAEREQHEALLTADRTRGGFLRWSPANAARVLRAFGKPVPAEWTASPAGPEAT
ncbi:MAG TPA: hypothetical protein VFS09_06465 [Candidatus Eisenbacteria bacterium]|nr:hypothetical protein [Candidatus Eisenbacteria bacterium]